MATTDLNTPGTPMRTIVKCRSHVIVGLALLLALSPAVLFAQVSTDSSTVTLVASSDLAGGAVTNVVRSDNGAGDIIFVDVRRAKAEDLAAAVALLGALQLQNRHGVRAVPAHVEFPANWQGGKYQGYLMKLKGAGTRAIPGLGEARAVDLRLPPPRGYRKAS